MDPLDDLLRQVRAHGAEFDRRVLSAPWALRFDGAASLTLCAPLRGRGWIVRGPGSPPRRLEEGETAVLRGPGPFVFVDDPATAARPDPVRDVRGGGPGADAQPAGDPVGALADDLAVDPAGDAVVLVGSYRFGGDGAQRLLGLLPPVAVVPDDDCTAVREYLHLQALLDTDRPDRQVVLDRLLDWLLVCTLREWFDRPEADPPAWYRALGDDVVGPVLRAVHREPGRPWTLASLAAEAAVSRTTLAKRFRELVGEPPLAYLAQWRMALASDLLEDPAVTVAEVARRVGYADAFGFSAAFKRLRGVSPSAHRAGAAHRPPGSAPGRRGATGGEGILATEG
ncbi:AraC family transcriptional regulator [Streptomyces thermolineatus]|uniref:AraC family transcriptional regulator n=1 Tax=Streptomyces thermolineatus TaxID=44033 RepID=UPI00384ADA2E